MKTARRLVIGIFLTIIVIAISTCGIESDKAKAVNSISTTDPIDLSGVNWTELARFMYGRCGEYHDLAISVGWTEAHWKKLSFVMYRESRCNTMSFNKTDPNGGSRGLIQINGFWCKPSRYYPLGYLQTQGVVSTCDNLYNPLLNLLSALEIFNYSVVHNDGNGWHPWAMPKDFCDSSHGWCDPPAIVGG